MSSLARSLAIVDLFTVERPVWSAEELIEASGYSRPTGYRYVRELVATGLLTRVGAGLYGLGPRIIELDYLIRRADPMLTTGLPVIRALVDATGCEVMLAGLYGEHIVTTHQEPGIERLQLTFGRGQPMPLVRGAGSKVIVAHFTKPRLAKLYKTHAKALARVKLGRTWDEFRAALTAIRRAGFAVSHGELDSGFVGVAAPVFTREGEILGSLIAALSEKRLAITDLDELVARVRGAAAQITAGIATELASPPAPRPRERRTAANAALA